MIGRAPRSLALGLGLFVCLASHARAGDPTHLFSDGFNGGHLGHWSDNEGNVCPEIGAGDELGEIGTYLGDRYIVYSASENLVENVAAFALLVELWEAFDGPMAPGTINLGVWPETDYNTCGTCILYFENFDRELFTYDAVYYQREGELEITTLDPQVGGTFAATVNAVLHEANINWKGSPPVPGGCVIPLFNYSFSETLVPAN